MPSFKVGPKCCCTCVLLTDTFDGTLAPEWEQIAGSWSIIASLLETDSTDALVVHETAVPGNAGKIFSTMGATPATGYKWRIVAYLDEDNYAYIEFEYEVFGTLALQLGYFNGGVETVLDTATNLLTIIGAAGEDGDVFRLCWDGVRLVGGMNNCTLSGDYTAPNALRPGFATGATGSDWKFSTVELSHHIEQRSNCPSCKTCWDLCETYPSTIEVYIPAGTFTTRAFTSAWICTGNCENLNDQTFVLNLTNDPLTGCPMYEYTEAAFCDIESPFAAGSYSATLTIQAKFRRYYIDGGGAIEVSVNIASDCFGTAPFGGACQAGSYGNISTHTWTTFDPLDVATVLATWQPCVDVDIDTAGSVSYANACESVTAGSFPFFTCTNPLSACAVDTTKQFVISL
jgi:hypothetical protein